MSLDSECTWRPLSNAAVVVHMDTSSQTAASVYSVGVVIEILATHSPPGTIRLKLGDAHPACPGANYTVLLAPSFSPLIPMTAPGDRLVLYGHPDNPALITIVFGDAFGKSPRYAVPCWTQMPGVPSSPPTASVHMPQHLVAAQSKSSPMNPVLAPGSGGSLSKSSPGAASSSPAFGLSGGRAQGRFLDMNSNGNGGNGRSYAGAPSGGPGGSGGGMGNGGKSQGGGKGQALTFGAKNLGESFMTKTNCKVQLTSSVVQYTPLNELPTNGYANIWAVVVSRAATKGTSSGSWSTTIAVEDPTGPLSISMFDKSGRFPDANPGDIVRFTDLKMQVYQGARQGLKTDQGSSPTRWVLVSGEPDAPADHTGVVDAMGTHVAWDPSSTKKVVELKNWSQGSQSTDSYQHLATLAEAVGRVATGACFVDLVVRIVAVNTIPTQHSSEPDVFVVVEDGSRSPGSDSPVQLPVLCVPAHKARWSSVKPGSWVMLRNIKLFSGLDHGRATGELKEGSVILNLRPSHALVASRLQQLETGAPNAKRQARAGSVGQSGDSQNQGRALMFTGGQMVTSFVGSPIPALVTLSEFHTVAELEDRAMAARCNVVLTLTTKDMRMAAVPLCPTKRKPLNKPQILDVIAGGQPQLNETCLACGQWHSELVWVWRITFHAQDAENLADSRTVTIHGHPAEQFLKLKASPLMKDAGKLAEVRSLMEKVCDGRARVFGFTKRPKTAATITDTVLNHYFE